jgi:hypothetical protein
MSKDDEKTPSKKVAKKTAKKATEIKTGDKVQENRTRPSLVRIPRQLLIGVSDGNPEIILVADTVEKLQEMKEILSKAGTDKELSKFNHLEVWNRAQGHSRSVPVGLEEARKALLAKEREAIQKAKESQREDQKKGSGEKDN